MSNEIQKARDVLESRDGDRMFPDPEVQSAIDGLLAHVIAYPAWTSGHMRTYANNIAAAIIAADERMNA